MNGKTAATSPPPRKGNVRGVLVDGLDEATSMVNHMTTACHSVEQIHVLEVRAQLVVSVVGMRVGCSVASVGSWLADEQVAERTADSDQMKRLGNEEEMERQEGLYLQMLEEEEVEEEAEEVEEER